MRSGFADQSTSDISPPNDSLVVELDIANDLEERSTATGCDTVTTSGSASAFVSPRSGGSMDGSMTAEAGPSARRRTSSGESAKELRTLLQKETTGGGGGCSSSTNSTPALERKRSNSGSGGTPGDGESAKTPPVLRQPPPKMPLESMVFLSPTWLKRCLQGVIENTSAFTTPAQLVENIRYGSSYLT